MMVDLVLRPFSVILVILKEPGIDTAVVPIPGIYGIKTAAFSCVTRRTACK